MDYANWPYAPTDGYRSGNNYLTQALFVETSRSTDVAEPRFSLGESDVEWNGRLLPSARLIYINSLGEHDAMRKLVGSYKQWTRLKELEWFRSEWELWHQEWLMIEGEKARKLLQSHAMLTGGTSAAKTLFEHSNKNGVGRPAKKKTKHDDGDAVDSDVSRVIQLRKP